MKKRILFVDDEPQVLQGLQRMLYFMRRDWEMAFADGGRAALAQVAQHDFDVMVTDMRMPGMDGAQLLAKVQQQYPHIVRIVLSGHSDRELVLKSVGPAHQYLAKPCEPDKLKETIARAGALGHLVGNEALRQRAAGMQCLPSLPSPYFAAIESVHSPATSLERVGGILATDIGMTVKILQLANSAFFGLPRRISSMSEAVKFLGLDVVKALICSSQVFTRFSDPDIERFALDRLWEQSLAVATCARRIAQLEGCEATVIDDTFMAGLLHDTGKLVLATHEPQACLRARTLVETHGLTEWEAERAILGVSHAEVGGYLLDLWGLPGPIVESVVFHHCPTAQPHEGFRPLTAIHASDAIVHELHDPDGSQAAVPIDHDYLLQLGLSHRLPVWRQAYQDLLHNSTANGGCNHAMHGASRR